MSGLFNQLPRKTMRITAEYRPHSSTTLAEKVVIGLLLLLVSVLFLVIAIANNPNML